MSKKILGISAYYHDSAAALLVDGELVAAAQEERFTRIKHDATFPSNAIEYCLQEANVTLLDIDHVVFYDKPLIKFERLLETYISFAPVGFRSFMTAIPVWLKEKLFLKTTLRRELQDIAGEDTNLQPSLLFTEHHQAHAASAFFPSPFESAAIICVDGVGEWATTSVWEGQGNTLTPVSTVNFPHSLGLLYSAFTYYAGFKVNSGEYKLMGLAPYGEPRYVDEIKNHLIDIKSDGSYRLDMTYFNYAAGLTMTSKRFHKLFDGLPRAAESEITQKEMDLARSIQVVTEEVLVKMARHVRVSTGKQNLCLAGGVALNCVANGVIMRENIFDNVWVQPAAGDAGGAVGAAYAAWFEYEQRPRQADGLNDKTRGSYLGPCFSTKQIEAELDAQNAVYTQLSEAELMARLSEYLASESVVGWFQGRMEFGPRALGGRSILGDPRSTSMQSTMNLKIKYRESFRPFAPSVKSECVADWFELDADSPYMLVVAPVAQSHRLEAANDKDLFGVEKLNIPRSKIPAVTHVDYSARVQSVHQQTNPRYWKLLDAFESITGCPVLINTSFNVRGEPIVCTPTDAYRCFMRTGMDVLVIEDVMLLKSEQPAIASDDSWQSEFELD